MNWIAGGLQAGRSFLTRMTEHPFEISRLVRGEQALSGSKAIVAPAGQKILWKL